MKKLWRSGLLSGLLLIAASCDHNEARSPAEQATADQKAIREYLDTHTYAQGAIRMIGELVQGKKIQGEPFSKSAQKLPSGIWIWTRDAGQGQRPSAQSKILVHYQGTVLKDGETTALHDTQDKAGQKILGSSLNEGSGQPVWIDLKDQSEAWWTTVMTRYRARDRDASVPYDAQGVAFIPSAAGFGRRLLNDIPTDAVLVYEFEIYQVKP